MTARKSRTLSAIDLDDDEGKLFKRGVEAVGSMPEETLLALAKGLPALAAAKTRRIRTEIVERQIAELGITRVDAGLAADYVLSPLLRAFCRDEANADTPQDILADLQDLRLVSPSNVPKLSRVLSFLKDEVAPLIERESLQRSTATGVFPSINSIGTTVELRGAFKDTYELGKSIEDYVPNLQGVVPVVSVHIGTDADSNEEFVFQTDEEELAWLIASLQAAHKDLVELKNRVSVQPSDQ